MHRSLWIVVLSGSGSSQAVKFGLGELSRLDIGPLALRNIPAASVPLPALSVFEPRRPEVILGYSLFALSAIRIDYAHSRIELARTSEALVTDKMIALPIVDLD